MGWSGTKVSDLPGGSVSMEWSQMEEVVRNRLMLMLCPEQKDWAARAAHDIVMDIRMEFASRGGLTYHRPSSIITPDRRIIGG